jgi:hypothetical protein
MIGLLRLSTIAQSCKGTACVLAKCCMNAWQPRPSNMQLDAHSLACSTTCIWDHRYSSYKPYAVCIGRVILAWAVETALILHRTSCCCCWKYNCTLLEHRNATKGMIARGTPGALVDMSAHRALQR